MRKFDLNIEKILEDWEVHHALRELIANALDEQKLSKTSDIKIFRDGYDQWHIRDFGRGITHEHFTQNENDEKLTATGIIGKFGIGLKDALATFDRKSVDVKLISKFGVFTVGKSTKIGFDEITTLHVYINPAQDSAFVGTDIVLTNIQESDIQKAKEMFLVFSGEEEIESTSYGSVLNKKSIDSKIYINGVKVAEEPNFLFTYNVTNLNAVIKKALNRERTNVGRAAYSDRIKSILLSCNSWVVASALIKDLGNYSHGKKHDELNWIDVQEHATKIYSKVEKVVFVTSNDIEKSADIVDEAKETGHKLVVIPENLREKVQGTSTEKTTLISQKEIQEKPQLIEELKEAGHNVIVVPEAVKQKADLIEATSGNAVNDFSNYVNQRNQNFEFQFVSSSQLTSIEKDNFALSDYVLSIIAGIDSKPHNITSILISETMQRDDYSFKSSEGLYQNQRIIIKRSVLSDQRRFLSVLLHEIAHAISGASDATRAFESELSRLLGIFCEKIIAQKRSTEKSVIDSSENKQPPANKSFWDKIFK
jgi:hypothetical protein